MHEALFSPLVERAMRTAACCHRNHHRKASDLPYIAHPASVALILVRSGFDDEQVLAAALLHDVVEDTSFTMEELTEQFPPHVVEYVAALTERKHDSEGRRRSWRDRKQEHLGEIADASLEARAIVLADKLHNLSAMLYDLEAGDELWSRFGAPPADVLWYHREMVARAEQNEPRLEALAAECRKALARLEQAVPTK